MKDKIVAGIVVGILADFIKLLINYAFFRLGMIKTVFWQIAATRFLNSPDLFKPVAYIIGGLVDLTTTAALGAGFIYVIHWSGRDYIWIKGAGYGLLVWVVLFGTVLSQSAQRKLPADSTTIMATAVAHLFFGLALAYFANRLYQKNTFR